VAYKLVGHERKKRNCRQITKAAVRDYILIRPGHCECCGVKCRPDCAHVDYDEPLIVVWLCKSCHKLWDLYRPEMTASQKSSQRAMIDYIHDTLPTILGRRQASLSIDP